jgi:signal peptidase I
MLECEVVVEQAKGELVSQLSKGIDRFEARFNLSDGTCTLQRLTYEVKPGKNDKEQLELKEEKNLGSAPSPLDKPGTYRLRFSNFDERLVVWVDGKLIFGDGVNYPPPSRRGPYANDLEPASIGVEGASVKIAHLKLWRDTYYTAQLYLDENKSGAGDGDALGPNPVDRSKPETWGPLRKAHARTVFVQPGHYLCMGDNSPESSDSRYWGSVPERLMLGRALMIYYPFQRAGRIK